MQDMMSQVEGKMSNSFKNEDSMFHAFVEGNSRVVDGQVELMLKDGTWYPMQSKLEEMDKNYSGIKWTAFNVGRDNEPRFAGGMD